MRYSSTSNPDRTCDLPTALCQLDEDVFLLELFYGPSLAFKDVGARFLTRLLARLATEADAPLTLLVATSGNFGNLTAGLLAHTMGLPAAGLVAATNANEVVPRFLDTGRLEARATVATLSNAMDVGRPSNLERIQALFRTRAEDLRARFSARSFDDKQTAACIRETHRESGVVLDPHTAVGLLGLRAELRERGGGGA